MSNETNETIADIVSEMRGPYYKMGRSNASLDKDMMGYMSFIANRIEAAHKREKIKFESALDIQKNNVAKLCELLKEFADVLSDTKNYACFGCTIRGCPGEHECRYTKKYCLLVDKAREAIRGAE